MKLDNAAKTKRAFILHTIQSDLYYWYQFVPAEEKGTFIDNFISIFSSIDMAPPEEREYSLIKSALSKDREMVSKLFFNKGNGPFNFSLLERIFSLKNSFGKKYKLITVLGITFKIRRKKCNY